MFTKRRVLSGGAKAAKAGASAAKIIVRVVLVVIIGAVIFGFIKGFKRLNPKTWFTPSVKPRIVAPNKRQNLTPVA